MNLDVENCPITTCGLYEDQSNENSCGTDPVAFTGTEIYFDGLNIMAATNLFHGFSYTLCVKCTNGFQNVEKGNWIIQQPSQCYFNSISVVEDLQIIYEFLYAPGQEKVYELTDMFLNQYLTECPLTSCGIYTTGLCGVQVFAASVTSNLYMDPDTLRLHWTEQYPLGYSYSFCVQCLNSFETVEVDNFVVT